MYKLVIQDDEGKTTVVPLIRDELSIGRKEGNTIRLTERNVSRRHAKVYRQNGAISIEDCDSYNGIRVNGTRIQGRVELKESDRVQIGDYLIEIKSDAVEKASPAEQTQPIERVDPMATTPIPIAAEAAPTIRTPVIAEGTSPGHAVPAAPEPPPPLIPPAARADSEPAGIPALGAAAQAAPNARVVVLSTNFAGQEFELDKPAMVIGRTDENDIWINHRSISRHHAKIVRENGRYAIVDLQSSNGVRVNGEEYGKVELRRGDVIDLGHVRLRFIEPGEDFVFGRDAQPVDLTPQTGGRGAMYLVLGVLAIAAGVGGWVFMQGKDRDNEDPTTLPIAAPDPPDTQEPVVAVASDAAIEAVDPIDTTSPQIRDLLEKAEEAILAENWQQALQLAQEAQRLDPDSEQAKRVFDHARAELAAQMVYEDLTRCKVARCVVETFERLDENSLYRLQARKAYDKAVEAYKGQVRQDAQRLARKNQRDPDACARALDDLARDVLPSFRNQVMGVKSRECKAQVVVAPPDPTPPPGNGGSDPDPPDRRKSAQQLVAEGQTAAKAGQFSKALRLGQEALKVQRGHPDALMLCAISACNLKSQSLAQRYINQIKPAGQRGAARQICASHGIVVP